MYRRFLNNNDYLGVITEKALSEMTRGNMECFVQAEEAAETSIVEYLSENYEVQNELNKGKYIAEYDRKITFPIGAHIYYEGKYMKLFNLSVRIRLRLILITGKSFLILILI